MDVVEKINAMISPSLSAMGYSIVQLKLADSSKRKTLTLMAERTDGVVMGFDDCTDISRTVSALMDVEDPIASAYNLEVCSPGLDRPLMKLDDYVRFAGHEAKVETLIPLEGRKRFKGVIEAPEKDNVMLTTTEGKVMIAFRNIRSAKLVATDALLEDFMKQQKKQ